MRILFLSLGRKRGRALLAKVVVGGRLIEIIGSFCGQGKAKIAARSYRYLNVAFSGVWMMVSLPEIGKSTDKCARKRGISREFVVFQRTNATKSMGERSFLMKSWLRGGSDFRRQ
ncbi:MAG: hypothetical protein WAN60_08490 [Candidatus Sulfotelmatobacter sp.]